MGTLSENQNIKKMTTIRNSFEYLCGEFPSLSLSITSSEKQNSLHVRDNTGKNHTICLENLLRDTTHAIHDITLSIKQAMKLYDA